MPERRVKHALRASGLVPEVSDSTLATYHRFLTSKLAFPFKARYPEPIGLGDEVVRSITVTGLVNPTEHTSLVSTGLLCHARDGVRQFEVPLADIEVDFEDSNHQFVEDYWYWFWNWQ